MPRTLSDRIRNRHIIICIVLWDLCFYNYMWIVPNKNQIVYQELLWPNVTDKQQELNYCNIPFSFKWIVQKLHLHCVIKHTINAMVWSWYWWSFWNIWIFSSLTLTFDHWRSSVVNKFCAIWKLIHDFLFNVYRHHSLHLVQYNINVMVCSLDLKYMIGLHENPTFH